MRLYRFFLHVPPGAPPLAAGQTAALDADESAHARRVLRLRAGDAIRAFDGAGREFSAELLAGPEKEPLRVRLIEEFEVAGESPATITLALAITKKDALDTALEKAVELGAARLLLLPAARSVSKLDERRLDGRQARWRKLVAEASKQCERAKLMEIEALDGLEALAKLADAEETPVYFLAERRPETPSLAEALRRQRDAAGSSPTRRPAVILVVGPEGGWTAGEVAQAEGLGWKLCSLGPRILRAETAAIAALAIAQATLGDL